VAVLIAAGLQVPLIPFEEASGRTGAILPWQSGPIAYNVGRIEVVTTISIVVVVAHWFTSGVNKYVVVEILFRAGDQVPLIPLFDVVGRAVNVAPEHIGATAVNVGTIVLLLLTVNAVVGDSQPLSVTVTSYKPGLRPPKSPVAFVIEATTGFVPVTVYVIPVPLAGAVTVIVPVETVQEG
jgi:hypothetical protein